MPLFSTVIPIYNVEPYLRECLDSVLRQTCADWEAICVDDGSTDGSGEILKQYAARDSRFRIITQPNGGLSAARNTGIDNAKGDYVLFLDSDDWVEPNYLEIIHSEIEKLKLENQPVDMLCFGGWKGISEECPSTATYPTGWDYYNDCALKPHLFPFVCVVLRCYRRQMLTDNTLRFFEGILHEDNHFTPRVCDAAGHVEVIPTPLYHYRLREGSIMTTRGLRSKESLIKIANDLSEQFGNTKGIDKTTVYQALTQYYQMAFIDNTLEEDRHLKPILDWRCYRRVSRTKPRHRINHLALRISPLLFRLINHQ